MKKIINICILWMCQLALFGQARIGDNPDYNPTNPGDPQVPVITKTYGLSTVVSPVGSGSTNFSSTQQYAEGKSVYVRAYNNTGYQFVNWLLGDSVVSTSASFYYTMPAKNVTLTAVFKYNPSNPADPDSLGLKYDLKVVASPKQGGSFNVSSTEVQEGHSTNLYAYPNTGFRFKGWQLDGEIVSTVSPYNYTMGDKDVTITGVFEYNPSNPSNPGKNSWNKATGEVIVDDFTAGSLYDAVYQVTNGNEDVSMITVSGEMNYYDFGIANNYSNCTMIDLKRTYGYANIPSYCYYYNGNLTSIVLPSCIETIEYCAFEGCSNLTNITSYAITPPTVESYAFDGISEGAVLHVLSAAIPLYAEAEGWKDFTILPLTEEVQALEVNLPAGSEDGRFKNMTLELVNAESGQKQKYVISDRVSYTFNGLLKKSIFNVYVKNNMGAVLGQIENIVITDEDVSVTFESLLQPQNITLNVQTPDGTDVTSQAQIRWFNSADEYLQQGNKLTGLLAGTVVRYSIKLPQALGMQYVLPTDSVYTIQEENNALVCTLQPLEEVTIGGRVKDVTTGSTLSGAVVSVSQKLNGLYSKAFTVKTNNKGEFTAKVFNDQSIITVSATDYLNQTLEFANFNDTTFVGEVALKSITGATIATSFTYRTSVEEGTVPEIQNWYADYANVAYDIYNETQQRAITQFNVQYPNIVLLEEVAEGDVLKLTASSRTNAFVPVTATATIDAQNRAETIFDIVELGAIKAGFTSTDNASVVGILYDSKGQLMKKYTYSNASLSISNLADGNYTLVSMTNSSLFNSILNLSQFAASGLKEGTDYVRNTVTVKSGVVATISNDLIPVLDESKLYYTGDNTLFSVNKTSIVAGNYLTLKGKIDFKSAYSSKVSDISMVVDLPESCSFVENSVMVGSNISSYTLDGNRLIIPLTGKYTDQVRFCVIPTVGGDYAPSAFAQFTLDNKEVLQPIGNAKFAVKDLTISVPSTVAKTSIPISGTALGNSTVEIFDNGVKIGETTSLANGVWSTTCELDEPYNLSTHSIYAKVTTKQGLELQSETKECMYDKNAIEPLKVTMINVAHPATSLELCEYVTVFDFTDPSKSKPAYWYWPSYPDFTFLIDFTSNDTTLISDVKLNILLSDNSVKTLFPIFDDKKSCWIVQEKFYSNALPTNVNISYNANTTYLIDANELQQSEQEIFDELALGIAERNNLIEKWEMGGSFVDSVYFATLDSLLGKDEVSSVEIQLHLDKIINDSVESEDCNLDSLLLIIDEHLSLSDVRENEVNVQFEQMLNKSTISSDSLFMLPDEYEYVAQTLNGFTIYKKTSLSKINEIELLSQGYVKHEFTDGASLFFHVDVNKRIFIDTRTKTKIEITTVENEDDPELVAKSKRSGSPMCVAELEGISHAMIDICESLKNINTIEGLRATISSSCSLLKSAFESLDCIYQSGLQTVEDALEDIYRNIESNLQLDKELLKGDIDKLSKVIKAKNKEFERLEKKIVDCDKQLKDLENNLLNTTDGAVKIEIQKQIDEQNVFKNTIVEQKSSLQKDIRKANSKLSKLYEKHEKVIGKIVDNRNYYKSTNDFLAKIPRTLSVAKNMDSVRWTGRIAKFVGTSIGATLQIIPLGIDIYELMELFETWGNLAGDILAKYPCPDDPNGWVNLATKTTVSAGASLSSGLHKIQCDIGSIALDYSNHPYAWVASLCVDLYSWGFSSVSNKFTSSAINVLRTELETLRCNLKEDMPDNNPIDYPWWWPFPPVGYVMDPSGYVYEGVSSNRIEGVMATAYYKETVEDMYGDLHENVVLWDAEEYAQENPLFTDEYGMYAWDVPQGLWQVKFEKEGYQTTYSEWLPVPPPQLEVNIAMTQNKQPEVKAARAYEDGIEVEFDKYMQLDGLTTENIFVTKNGETAAGTVTLLNEEQAYEDNPVKYASKVRFVPEASFQTTDEVTLTVSRKVKSYAGIQMGEDYTQSFDIEKEVKSIVADSLIKVNYNGSKQITVSALPYDAAIGKKMIVKNSSSMIATISADTLTFDANGQASLTLNGDLPGTAMLTFTLAETDVKALSTVQVVIPELKMTDAPKATRASGTAVYRGTEVGLTCETEGAVIYYTLDGSCPCDENAPRQIYKTPIAITEDMTIKAMAVVDVIGESEVAEFSFTIKRTNLGMELKEGWNWVSHNMETEVPTTALPQNATRIVGQTAELVNDPVYGLMGNLKTLQPDEAYKVQMATDSIHVMNGYEFNPATNIDLKSGWNWLGYPVNQTMSLSEAFANMQPDNEDYIVGQDGFAQYADGTWTGTLLTLNPGMGYLYHSQSDKAFAYNSAIVSKARAVYGRGIKNETPWAVDKNKYPNVMPLVADIYVDGRKQTVGSYAVGAFCGTECRGVGKYVDGKLMMNIYGEGNEQITFRAVNNETEEMFDIVEKATFTETLLGSILLPYALNVGDATGIAGVETAWKVWPATPSDKLYLSLNGEAFDRVTLVDAYGNVALVKTQVEDGEAIRVALLAEGVYIVVAEQNGKMYYKKIVKIGK